MNNILKALQEVHAHPQIQIRRLATPISMKNKYQMKGFIVYVKVVEESMVPCNLFFQRVQVLLDVRNFEYSSLCTTRFTAFCGFLLFCESVLTEAVF